LIDGFIENQSKGKISLVQKQILQMTSRFVVYRKHD